MPAVLHEDQELKRIVKVYGVDAPVVAIFTSTGVTLKVKGTIIGVSATWAQVADRACVTPLNVPSKLHGRSMLFLQDNARKASARLEKKLDKEMTSGK